MGGTCLGTKLKIVLIYMHKTEIKMNAQELIKKIFSICQSTPQFNDSKDIKTEAERLDKAITDINFLCDIFLYENKDI
jgi:hypothetical protein